MCVKDYLGSNHSTEHPIAFSRHWSMCLVCVTTSIKSIILWNTYFPVQQNNTVWLTQQYYWAAAYSKQSSRQQHLTVAKWSHHLLFTKEKTAKQMFLSSYIFAEQIWAFTADGLQLHLDHKVQIFFSLFLNLVGEFNFLAARKYTNVSKL